MEYSIAATSLAKNDGAMIVKQSKVDFGTTDKAAGQLANPAELFLGAFAACMLKNVERFSGMLPYEYHRAELQVNATRFAQPARMDHIKYELTIFSKDEKLRVELLKKNLEKFGTIYNTVRQSCSISGTIKQEKNYV